MTNKQVILIIEDEKNIGNYIETIVISNGYKALRAMNGMSGLSLCTSHHPDLILLDLGLPDIDGSEVLERVRGFSAVPVIVISARTQEAEKVQALDQGADDYITKPFGQDRTAMESNDTAAGMPYMAYIRHKKEYVNIPPQGLLMSELSDIIKASYQ